MWLINKLDTLRIRLNRIIGKVPLLESLTKQIPGISGKAQPSTFFGGTATTFSAAQSPFWKEKYSVFNYIQDNRF